MRYKIILEMKFLQYLSILVGIGSLAWEYFSGGHDSLARWILLFGLVWLVTEINRPRKFASFGLPVCLLLAGFGLWLDLSPGWMLAGSLGALLAWDLADFTRRAALVSHESELQAIRQRHLNRLLIITASGLFLSLAGINARFDFTFEWIPFLVLLAALGATQLAGWMSRGK